MLSKKLRSPCNHKDLSSTHFGSVFNVIALDSFVVTSIEFPPLLSTPTCLILGSCTVVRGVKTRAGNPNPLCEIASSLLDFDSPSAPLSGVQENLRANESLISLLLAVVV